MAATKANSKADDGAHREARVLQTKGKSKSKGKGKGKGCPRKRRRGLYESKFKSGEERQPLRNPYFRAEAAISSSSDVVAEARLRQAGHDPQTSAG